jgi:hypothetical protein
MGPSRCFWPKWMPWWAPSVDSQGGFKSLIDSGYRRKARIYKIRAFLCKKVEGSVGTTNETTKDHLPVLGYPGVP